MIDYEAGDTESQIVCRVCGARKREISGHLRMHGLTSQRYREMFPNAPMICEESRRLKSEKVSEAIRKKPREISEETRKKLSSASKRYHQQSKDDPKYIKRQRENAALARKAKGPDYRHSEETIEKMRGPRVSMIGRKFSDEHRANISKARKKITGWKHKPETLLKMRLAWERRKLTKEYEDYIKSVSDRLSSEENVKRLRDIMADRVAKTEHNGKAKDTKLEIDMKKYLTENEVAFTHQRVLHTEKGAFTFDFYLPEFNLFLEVDGEYWHRKSVEQINRDILKEKLCKAAGYRFLRISDKNWKPSLIFATDNVLECNNTVVLAARRALFDEAFPPDHQEA